MKYSLVVATEVERKVALIGQRTAVLHWDLLLYAEVVGRSAGYFRQTLAFA